MYEYDAPPSSSSTSFLPLQHKLFGDLHAFPCLHKMIASYKSLSWIADDSTVDVLTIYERFHDKTRYTPFLKS